MSGPPLALVGFDERRAQQRARRPAHELRRLLPREAGDVGQPDEPSIPQADRIATTRAEGVALIAEALGKGSVGEYQLQAAIAAVHSRAARAGHRLAGEDGPATCLALLRSLDEPLAGHHRLHAVRAHLLDMAGERDAAIAEYEAAASRTTSLPEQHYLTRQAARLNERRA